jgi:hypothetical protein
VIQIAQAGNTVVPAILALEELGLVVDVQADQVVASSSAVRFIAEDPVAVLGLVRLLELRGADWMAKDEDIAAAFERFPNL